MSLPKPSIEELKSECSTLSLKAQEPLPGTASRVDVWLLLSYAGPMGAKAFTESTLPPEVKAYLNEQLEAIPHSRLLLIKPQNNEETIRFYVANGSDTDPRYYAFDFERYEDLLELDLPSLVAGDLPDAGPGDRTPFYLVCTNGKRDACCARYGMPVYEALRSQNGADVWQSSHVSGHRFAANVLMFPHGIYYGRVTPENSAALLEAGASGLLSLAHYRGRAGYDPIVQAGEALLRESTGNLALDAYRYLDHSPLDEDRWRGRFAATADGQVHELTIRATPTDDHVFVSCRGEKQSPVLQYVLDRYVINK